VKRHGLVFVLPLILAVCFGCDKTRRRVRTEADTGNQAWQVAIDELARQHEAVLQWENRLPDRGGWPFTLDLSKALIQTNGKPVLLVMELNDVSEKEGNYFARFTEYFGTNGFFQLLLEIQCTEDQASKLLRTEDDFFPYYAIVARISQVSRARFAITEALENDDRGLDIEGSRAVFLAKGVCVDLLEEARGKTEKR